MFTLTVCVQPFHMLLTRHNRYFAEDDSIVVIAKDGSDGMADDNSGGTRVSHVTLISSYSRNIDPDIHV